MTARDRTVEQKSIDALEAFDKFSRALTPDPMRGMINKMTEMPTENVDLGAYASLVQGSIHLARIVAANDRAALIAAVMATQSGVARPTLDVIDGGEA